MKKVIASVDTGGTKILVSILDAKGKILSTTKKASKVNGGTKPNILKRIINAISEAMEDLDSDEFKLSAIVIGVPGTINPDTGLIYLAPNLGLKNFLISDPIKQKFKVPVIVENDANLGTIGIHKYETEDKFRNMIGIFVGTGIGAGLVFDNKIYRGSNFTAGEIGHMIVEPAGFKCGCGQTGCFETMASRTAIARDIFSEIRLGKKTIITKLIGKNKIIKSGTLARAVEEKDKLTQKILIKASIDIGTMIANLANLLNLDAFVLAGGVIEACGDFMIPYIRQTAKSHALPGNFKGVKILKSKLGDNAAIFGGYALAKEKGFFK